DVCDVGDQSDFVALVLEPAAQHVEDDGPACVAEVRVGVDGGAAHVHADLAWHHRVERLFGSLEGVVELEWHRLLQYQDAADARCASGLWVGSAGVNQAVGRASPSSRPSCARCCPLYFARVGAKSLGAGGVISDIDGRGEAWRYIITPRT